MRGRLAIPCLVVLASSLMGAGAPGQGGAAPEWTLLGRARVSAIYDIEAVPPYAYALERGMVRVLDVRNPAAVREVGSLAIEGAPMRMAVRAPYLYLPSNDGPLGVVDISEPARPRWLGMFPELTGTTGDVFEAAGDVAYLVRKEDKSRSLWLDVIDLARDPARPRRLGSVDLGVRTTWTGGYGGIAQANGRAYLVVERPAGATNRSALVIVDASDPGTPRVERTALLPEGKRYIDIDVRGDLLFLLDSTPQKPNGLAIYRMRADGEPELVGEALTPEVFLPMDLVARGDVVYGTFKGGSILVTFDVSNPGSPTIADAYWQKDRWSAGLGMALVGDRLFVTGDNGPAPIFDVTAARTPRLLGRWEYEGGSAGEVMLDGTLAVVTNGMSGLVLVDVARRGAPARVGFFQGVQPGRSRSDFQWNTAMAARGSRVVVAHETKPAQVLDISHPGRPVVEGTFIPRGLVHAIALAPTHAFLGYRAAAVGRAPRMADPSSLTALGGIESVDLRNPRVPRGGAMLDLGPAVTDVARHGDCLVAVHADGSLTVVDIRVPDRPAVLGRLAGTGSKGAMLLVRPTRVVLSADGRLAYVTRMDAAAGAGILTVVDLSEAATPRRLGQLNLERPGRAELPLAVDGHRVAVLVGTKDVLLVDASDPARPAAFARHPLPPTMWATGLAFEKQTLFVAAMEDGLLIYRVPPASAGVPRQ